MKGRLRLFLLLLALPTFYNTYSQSLKNIKAETKGDQVIVTYDLESPDKEQGYKVSLYSSHNNYNQPLKLVSGDVGENVLPGKGKRITWDAKGEVRNFNGNITFEVRASTALPAIQFKNPISGTKFKRGKTYQITWEGGPTNADYNVVLFRNGVEQTKLGTSEDNRKFTWSVPGSMKAGGNYTIKLINGGEEITTSKEFAIKPKVPMLVKVLPVVAAGVIGAFFFLPPPPPDELPEAPGVPEG